MAAKESKVRSLRSKKNRSLAIRNVLRKMPSAKATEIAGAVKKEYGHTVKPNMVYMVKTKANMASDGRPNSKKAKSKSGGYSHDLGRPVGRSHQDRSATLKGHGQCGKCDGALEGRGRLSTPSIVAGSGQSQVCSTCRTPGYHSVGRRADQQHRVGMGVRRWNFGCGP